MLFPFTTQDPRYIFRGCMLSICSYYWNWIFGPPYFLTSHWHFLLYWKTTYWCVYFFPLICCWTLYRTLSHCLTAFWCYCVWGWVTLGILALCSWAGVKGTSLQPLLGLWGQAWGSQACPGSTLLEQQAPMNLTTQALPHTEARDMEDTSQVWGDLGCGSITHLHDLETMSCGPTIGQGPRPSHTRATLGTSPSLVRPGSHSAFVLEVCRLVLCAITWWTPPRLLEE